MTGPFNEHHVAATGGPGLTLVNGRTFTVARGDGTVVEPSDGTVFEDLRIVSHFTYDITDPADPHPRRQLHTTTPTPYHAVTVSQPDPRAPAADGEPAEYYVHQQWIGRGVRHDIEVHNASAEPIDRVVHVGIETDFAHIFDVKVGHCPDPTATLEHRGEGSFVVLDRARPDVAVEIEIAPPPDDVDRELGVFTWTLACPARSHRTVQISVEPRWDDKPAGLLFALDVDPNLIGHAVARTSDHDVASIETTDPRLAGAFEQALVDLASLRIYDPTHPRRVVVAAGAPWFMTLFGRDSLLSAWMALPFEPELAVGVLSALGDLQGSRTNPATEEERGKIIHELRRHGGDSAFGERGRYYGTVDATPLFVMLAAETRRWGHLADDQLAALWPNVRAAVGWIREKRAEKGDGFVHYQRSGTTGLLNQGWKDSGDGITFADGRTPVGSIALAEVQGYAYAALLGAAELTEHTTVADLDPEPLRKEAEELAESFNHSFWNEAASAFALGVTAEGEVIDSVTTNPGHALWCGISEPALAHRYLDRCLDDLWNGWGLRTLSPRAAAYNPVSYHNGSVWPHDTALVAAGAARHHRHDVVEVLFDAALDVATHFDGRPPELFAGIPRDEIPAPVSYPGSCSPQAWAAASVLLYLRSALGLEPAEGRALPATVRSATLPAAVTIRGLRSGPAAYDLTAEPS